MLLVFFLILTSREKQKEITTDDTKSFKAIEQLVQGIFDDIWSSKKAKLISKCHTNDFILLEHGEVWTNVTTGNWCEHVKKRDQGIERINTFYFFKTKR